MTRFNAWQDNLPSDEERRRRERNIADAMKEVIGEVMRPKGGPEDIAKVGQGEPAVNGIPERVLKQQEAYEKARVEQGKTRRRSIVRSLRASISEACRWFRSGCINILDLSGTSSGVSA